MRNELLLLSALLIAATALTSGDYGQSATASHVHSTTVHSNITGTTASPNTTTHSPNTTTHSPNTTTHSPNTTTHSPNTTTHSPNTTTHSPKTTTAPPAPTPSAKLTVGNYNLSDSGKLCFLAKVAMQIRVNSSKVNGTFIVQEHKTNVSGSCGEKVTDIFLSFNEGQIALKFRNNETSKMVYVETLEYDLTYAFKYGVSSNFSGKNESLWLFAAAEGHSYSCKAQPVYMGGGVHLDLSSLRIQAYNIKNNDFGTPDLCKADQPNYRVPIAVGIILIILIVIVVIAYLVSRKRRADGYQSL
ncbi:macrosialin [Myxocyprinus asiaticus]|uniref:macrosialin n=1 Tax=Myxocyprinus asiaticus TaxID=70543 RepID=UPI002223C062|nr:macrosialin [Myxocyprinus asiaticus]